MCYADFLKGPPETNERQSGYELHLYYRLWCYFYAAMNQADSKLGPCCLLQHIPKLRKIFSFGAHTPSLQHRRVKFVVHESSLRRLLHAKVPNGIAMCRPCMATNLKVAPRVTEIPVCAVWLTFYMNECAFTVWWTTDCRETDRRNGDSI